MEGLIQSHGGQVSNRQPKYVPIHVGRMFSGMWTNRSPLRDPSDLA